MDLREMGYDDREWINLAHERDRWWAYVRAAMNLRDPLIPFFLDQWSSARGRAYPPAATNAHWCCKKTCGMVNKGVRSKDMEKHRWGGQGWNPAVEPNKKKKKKKKKKYGNGAHPTP
ncbi:hypothetical protein ANN_09323 [Periplaneta americana]|uniref:Uncharacterized protein n=1 Tax=Periplaneta americana TaxID=6978 RepID=A0ABQ8TNX9_PERAM|nr:hypothetical protein ANN_09323 [Periplaneta americana]